MKLDDLIAGHVAGTTLDPAGVKLFLRTPPRYYQWGIHHRIDQTSLNQLEATDLFEFYLRHYVTGRHKTLQPVLRVVRAFVRQDATGAHHLIAYSLRDTRRSLLKLEWYELMPRLEAAQDSILALAPALDESVRPGVIRLLEESY